MENKQAEEEMKREIDTQHQETEQLYKTLIIRRIKQLNDLWESFSNQGMFEVHHIAERSQDESPKTSDNTDMETEAKDAPETSDSYREESRGTKRKMQDMEVEPEIKKHKTGMDEICVDTVGSVQQQNTKAKTDILTCDPALTTMMDAIKGHLSQAFIYSTDLRTMITCLLPACAEQNSLLQEIYTKILTGIKTLKELSEAGLVRIYQFHRLRAELVSKTVKYPTVEDYRIAVNQCDEKLRTDIERLLVTFRNSYSELYDVLIKNMPSLQELSKESSASMTS